MDENNEEDKYNYEDLMHGEGYVVEVDENGEDLVIEISDDEEFEGATSMSDEDIEVVDTAKLTFTKHSRPIFSSDLNKAGDLAVTGGEDDNAFVWDTTSGEVIFECTGHQDSVIDVGFNYDNTLIATGDMGGMVQVWSVKDKKLIWCYEGDDLEWLMWHPLANVLAGGCQSGDVYIWQIPQGNCKVLPSHGSRCTAGQFHPDGKRLLTGYDDGEVKLWDIKATSAIWSQPQEKGITSLEINGDGTLISIAPCGAIVKVSDGTPIALFLLEGETEIESHLFIDELGVFVSGSLTGQLSVWDLGRQTIRHQAKIQWAVTVMRKGVNGQVFVGDTDGSIFVCDVRTGTLSDTLTGHKAEILSLTVSQDGSKILSTSEDGTAKIFVVKQ